MEEKKEEGKKPDTKNTGQQKASTKAKTRSTERIMNACTRL